MTSHPPIQTAQYSDSDSERKKRTEKQDFEQSKKKMADLHRKNSTDDDNLGKQPGLYQFEEGRVTGEINNQSNQPKILESPSK